MPGPKVRETLQRLGLPLHYLLYLGTIEPRKNVLTLLRAYCALSAPLRERYPLLLVGGWGWNAGEVAAELRNARRQGVIHLGYVADEHLPALYNGARSAGVSLLLRGLWAAPRRDARLRRRCSRFHGGGRGRNGGRESAFDRSARHRWVA